MLLAIDVYYIDKKAKVVAVLFDNWTDSVPKQIVSTYSVFTSEIDNNLPIIYFQHFDTLKILAARLWCRYYENR